MNESDHLGYSSGKGCHLVMWPSSEAWSSMVKKAVHIDVVLFCPALCPRGKKVFVNNFVVVISQTDVVVSSLRIAVVLFQLILIRFFFKEARGSK